MLAPIFVVSSDYLVSRSTTQAAMGKITQKNKASETFTPGPMGPRYFTSYFHNYPVDKK